MFIGRRSGAAILLAAAKDAAAKDAAATVSAS
jgi:hypothetical protein